MLGAKVTDSAQFSWQSYKYKKTRLDLHGIFDRY